MPFAYEGADIFIATQVAIRHCNKKFGLVAVLGIDNALNHIDFRSAEKAFQALTCLAHISLRQMVIQTNMPGHYAFNALASRDYELFYSEELRQRRQLLFPPYSHFCFVKVRASNEEKSRTAAQSLFDRMSASPRPKGVKLLAVSPARIPKLRGNYYWQILMSAKDVNRMGVFIKNI